MNLFVIIQAHLSSSRLPRKIALPIYKDISVLEFMLKRLEQIKNYIYIAIGKDGLENELKHMCIKNDVKYFVGSNENVLQRYYECAKAFGAKDDDRQEGMQSDTQRDMIVRLTSDCPLIDVDILLKIVDKLNKNNNYDYCSNVLYRTYPRGLDVEAFWFKTLKNAYENATSSYDKEHVSTFIRNNNVYKKINVQEAQDNSHFRLSIDEYKDYEALKELVNLFDGNTDFSYSKLLKILSANPHIANINKDVIQKIT